MPTTVILLPLNFNFAGRVVQKKIQKASTGTVVHSDVIVGSCMLISELRAGVLKHTEKSFIVVVQCLFRKRG